MSSTFTKEDTNLIKGIAITVMVYHHVCPNNCELPFLLDPNGTWETLLASSGKICVALLTLLSGFGMAESWKRADRTKKLFPLRFTLSHYLQLLSLYIPAFFLILCLHVLQWDLPSYGGAAATALWLPLDILGLSRLLGGPALMADWYLGAVIMLYLLFPLAHFLTEKLKWGAVLLTTLPWILYYVKPETNTDGWLFYLNVFCLGILFSQTGFLGKMKAKAGPAAAILAIVFFGGAFLLRMRFALYADPFLALAALALGIYVIPYVKPLKSFLVFCGSLSATVWLIHGELRNLLAGAAFRGWLFRAVAVLFISLGLTLVLDRLKAHLGLPEKVRELRSRIL